MTLKALIFDVDGTLSNTETDGHLVAFNQTFKEFGLDWFWSYELYTELLKVTGGKERIKHYIEQYIPDFVHPTAKTQNLTDWIVSVHQAKTQCFIDISQQGLMPLRVGVKRLFDEALDAGLTLAIATTTTPANVVALISNTLGKEYLQNFAVIAAGDDAKRKKPDGEIYTYALNKLGLQAAECLAIEDSENGIVSATQAGIKTVITTNEYTLNHDFSGALLVLDQLGDNGDDFVVSGGVAQDLVGSKTLVDVELLGELCEKNC